MHLSESKEYYKKLLKEFDQFSSGYEKPGGATLLQGHRKTAVRVFGELQGKATDNPGNKEAANKAYRAQQLARKLGVMVGTAGSVGDPVEGEAGNRPVVFTRSGGYNSNKTTIRPGIGALLTGLPSSDVSPLGTASAEESLRTNSPTAARRARGAQAPATPPVTPPATTGKGTGRGNTLMGRIMARLTNKATSGGTSARPVSVR